MGFSFDETYNWNKKANNAFISAIVAVFSLFMAMVSLQDFILEIIVIGFIPVLVGVLQGVYYMNRSNYDYVTLLPDALIINQGPFTPRKYVNYQDIEYCMEVHDNDKRLITIKTMDNKEIEFHGEWLSEDNLARLKKELVKRTQNEKLFRTREKISIL
ncbi:hypothetical protein [Ornithinibacillus scapharcae]|uniref:hypothetical protein n=1 Tax=Ornithinibacillus scapharcae TaxID=1147159 RepID=UPI000225B67F|nr:hypothetical protein [Ornithinibacillus scapharcae]